MEEGRLVDQAPGVSGIIGGGTFASQLLDASLAQSLIAGTGSPDPTKGVYVHGTNG